MVCLRCMSLPLAPTLCSRWASCWAGQTLLALAAPEALPMAAALQRWRWMMMTWQGRRMAAAAAPAWRVPAWPAAAAAVLMRMRMGMLTKAALVQGLLRLASGRLQAAGQPWTMSRGAARRSGRGRRPAGAGKRNRRGVPAAAAQARTTCLLLTTGGTCWLQGRHSWLQEAAEEGPALAAGLPAAAAPSRLAAFLARAAAAVHARSVCAGQTR